MLLPVGFGEVTFVGRAAFVGASLRFGAVFVAGSFSTVLTDPGQLMSGAEPPSSCNCLVFFAMRASVSASRSSALSQPSWCAWMSSHFFFRSSSRSSERLSIVSGGPVGGGAAVACMVQVAVSPEHSNPSDGHARSRDVHAEKYCCSLQSQSPVEHAWEMQSMNSTLALQLQ